MLAGSDQPRILTIGHSTHPMDRFLGLLSGAGATAVADVRSSPYSRFSPQFSKDALKSALTAAGIAYTFLGKELGARSSDPRHYRHGRVQYALLAKSELFAEGIRRVCEGAKRYSIVLMCAEKDPIECHRALLVSRNLSEGGTPISHIHADGTLESQVQLEDRLLHLWKLPSGDMFKARGEFVAEAYALQGERVAYQDDQMAQQEITGT